MDRIFHPIGWYPQLLPIMRAWQRIREEALQSLHAMLAIQDDRSVGQTWKMLPLMPEAEDRSVMPEAICQRCRALAPHTVEIVGSLDGIQAYAFSVVEPEGRILAHRHTNPYVTATLCLQSGGQSYIRVDGQRQDFQDGEFIIFDYRRVHEVINSGAWPRVVLLTLWDIADGID